MSTIADFNDNELNAVNETLTASFKTLPELRLADCELRLDPTATKLVSRPTVVRVDQGATFAVFKTGESRYRCLFFYGPNEQFGTGINEYQDLKTCSTTLLQVQADYPRDYNMKMDAMTRLCRRVVRLKPNILNALFHVGSNKRSVSDSRTDKNLPAANRGDPLFQRG